MADNDTRTIIVVELTARATMHIPFTSENYIDCDTAEDAAEWERNQDLPEMAEAMVNQLSLAPDEGGATLTWTVHTEEVPATGD